ncbi:hypothetical protein LIER_04048 [Lithospermum erythrorhizon]|uniref:Pectinesterase inhibitor domain-containing protein n=1 Tax=Lithospermum erythrorhizon TaxID=34254 RepID=A0AAV3NZH3_LITER
MSFIKTFVFLALMQTILPSLLHADIIDDVCVKVQDPPFCRTFLRSTRNRAPNLVFLGRVSLSELRGNTNSNIDYLTLKSNIPTLKELYRRCLGAYKVAATTTDDCESSLIRTKDYAKVKSLAIVIKNNAQICIDTVSRWDDQVAKTTDKQMALANIVEVIGSMLSGGKRS